MRRLYSSEVVVTNPLIRDYNTSPNGVLIEPQGTLVARTDSAQLWQNTNGGTTWQQVGAGGGTQTDLPAVNVTNIIGNWDTIGSNNIYYTLEDQALNQPLPEVATSPYSQIQVASIELGGGSTVTFVPSGSDTISGRDQIDTTAVSEGLYVHDGVSTWVWMGAE